MGVLMSVTGWPGRGRARRHRDLGQHRRPLLRVRYRARAARARTDGRRRWVHTSLLRALIALTDFQAARWLVSHEVPNRRATTTRRRFGPACSRPRTATSTSPLGPVVRPAVPCHRDARADRQTPTTRLQAAFSASRRAPCDDRASASPATSAEWIEILTKAGVPCGPIYSFDQVSPTRR